MLLDSENIRFAKFLMHFQPFTGSKFQNVSQLKPTRAKLQNQNLHRRVAKRYCQIEPVCKKTIELSECDRVVT